VATIADAVENADLIILLTEWAEFLKTDPIVFSRCVKNGIALDARNILDKQLWAKSGFRFI
jgi:UDPglucose 6-dehydrogenase